MPGKQQLRKQYLDKRLKLSAAAYEALNQQLLEQFKTLNLNGLGCIHIFLPITKKNEPDTMLIIYWLKSVHPQMELAYPKTDFTNFTIASYLDDAQLQLMPNQQGITEPVAGTLIDVSRADMVIVPLLAFDKAGNRVGYGKGFYDRFMANCKPGTRFVGLSLFDPLNDVFTDIDQYDVKLTQCVTPTRVWNF